MTHAAFTCRIGDMRITRIDETGFALAPGTLYPEWSDASAGELARRVGHASLDLDADRVPLRTHLWVVEKDGLTIVVDTGIGNGKPRPFSALFDRLDNPVIQRFEAAGFDRFEVDHVLLTHLHVDHVGWNTQWEDGRWTPVFPNATHVFGERERAFFDTHESEPRRMVYEDSVLPLIEAELTRVIPDEGATLVEGIRFRPTFGHSVGHMAIEMESRGELALFSGDVMHSPIQVYRPQWRSIFCRQPDQARGARAWLLDRAADRHAAVFTAHFPETSAGRIERTAEGFAWTYLAANE
ncbi:MBL fold metallo-hydrolase [Caballeronia ptereochthonis]|uniref:Beta-lactamase-like protein n=1 Tax=Caballeronia ptereochthonis TaxID=1777144 RepID=A0A158B579_9BURK|nr:MBL fold metallo-hydrolase [Caballeronia ptereochthonis]SAK65139.1 Beta-lactamase-like protein [Caballeronia ptereochthonis]